MSIPLIVDTDPGVDDAVALILALHSPEVQVRAVTASYGNVGLGGHLRQRPPGVGPGRADRRAGGRRGGPPAGAPAGRAGARTCTARTGWAGTAPSSRSRTPRSGPRLGARAGRGGAARCRAAGDDRLHRAADQHRAAAGRASRSWPSKIGRIVVMGGAVSGGNVSAVSEFNVHADPEAAHRVLTQDEVPVTLVPLDLTLRCLADACLAGRAGRLRPAVRAARPGDRALPDLVPAPVRHRRVGPARRGGHAGGGVPGTVATTPMPVSVACDFGPARGMLVPDRRPDAVGPPVEVARGRRPGPGARRDPGPRPPPRLTPPSPPPHFGAKVHSSAG